MKIQRRVLAIFISIIILICAGAPIQMSAREKSESKKTDNSTYKQGDAIIFGSYEQDLVDGPDPIEWKILAISGKKALLLSNNILRFMKWNPQEDFWEKSIVTWKDSIIRRWLNDDFYKCAFDDDEKGIIENICKEIDMEHELMADLVKSKLAPEEWFEREITELFPDATSEDIKLVKDSVEKGMVKDIDLEANRLKKDIKNYLEKETVD